MPATHSLRIDFDEATGEVVALHRCAVQLGGHTVYHARGVALGADAAAALKAVLDANRELIQMEAGALAVAHVAAVAGKAQPGVKTLTAGGSLGALGGARETK